MRSTKDFLGFAFRNVKVRSHSKNYLPANRYILRAERYSSKMIEEHFSSLNIYMFSCVFPRGDTSFVFNLFFSQIILFPTLPSG
ncbi:hypothetical protein A2691_01355 [Candidatus Woesebacteria bacterium RIFCSPHIGHO2_01_FULL_39_23]|nr:MAG: hypothetical protein A2691_01355 [Candidatus Woesebacteria bacterium RIFCSPHIGHO2_01_FULL_39_23]